MRFFWWWFIRRCPLEAFDSIYLNTSCSWGPKKLLMDRPLQSRQMRHLKFNFSVWTFADFNLPNAILSTHGPELECMLPMFVLQIISSIIDFKVRCRKNWIICKATSSGKYFRFSNVDKYLINVLELSFIFYSQAVRHRFRSSWRNCFHHTHIHNTISPQGHVIIMLNRHTQRARENCSSFHPLNFRVACMREFQRFTRTRWTKLDWTESKTVEQDRLYEETTRLHVCASLISIEIASQLLSLWAALKLAKHGEEIPERRRTWVEIFQGRFWVHD